MKTMKNKKLLNILLYLTNIFLVILIFKEFKILDFCHTIIVLLSPIFWGYSIAWVIKPVMLYINNYFKVITSSIMTYLILISFLIITGYIAVPVIVVEVKRLIPDILNMYRTLNPTIMEKIDINKIISLVNKYSINIKDTILTIFYSLFIGFFFLISHEEVSKFFSKYIPSDLINDLSINLKSFVKGTLLDTLILFIMAIISFYIAGLPYALLFALIISITNIIPYIGPYIGGIPSFIVALNVNYSLGILILIIIIVLQIIESTFIHPYIMSKSVKISPIFIMISLIISGYFFGIFGMILSTPIASIIKTLYLYNKEFKVINLEVLYK